jgi:hypothetical protein
MPCYGERFTFFFYFYRTQNYVHNVATTALQSSLTSACSKCEAEAAQRRCLPVCHWCTTGARRRDETCPSYSWGCTRLPSGTGSHFLWCVGHLSAGLWKWRTNRQATQKCKPDCDAMLYRVFQKELYNFERSCKFIQRTCTVFWNAIM